MKKIFACVAILLPLGPLFSIDAKHMTDSMEAKLKAYDGVEGATPPSIQTTRDQVTFSQSANPVEDSLLGSINAPENLTVDDKDYYKNKWSAGNKWAGASVAVSSEKNAQGKAEIKTTIGGRIYETEKNIVSSDVKTFQKKEEASAKSTVGYYFEGRILGKWTKIEEGDVSDGMTVKLKGIRLYKSFFSTSWRYMLGPVPVKAQAGLIGGISTGTPVINFGKDKEGKQLFTVNNKPYSSLDVFGKLSTILDDLPPIVRPGDVGAIASLSLLHLGLGTDIKTHIGEQPCMKAGIDKLKSLVGKFYIYAYWKIISVIVATEVVGFICDNPWIKIPGCGAVHKVLKKVSKWVNYQYKEDLIDFPGVTLANVNQWYEVPACSRYQNL